MSIEKKKIDCVIIGGGPGGYPAAIRLAQAGKKVVLIEAKELGGTCLNCGCIPTKAYLANADVFRSISCAQQKGISVQGVQFDWTMMRSKKDALVKKLRTSLSGVLQSYGIEIIKGYASFLSAKTVSVVQNGHKTLELTAESFIIAAGSETKEIAAFPFDGKQIHSSTTILDIDDIPKSLLIVGGGVIGCEFASLFRTFGSDVYIVEALDRLLPFECTHVSKSLTRAFLDQGIHIKTALSVKSISKTKEGIRAELSDGTSIETAASLISIGRSLNTKGLALEKAGVLVEKGAIVVDEAMRTSVPHIWAVGDVTGKTMYAHAATHQGLVAAESLIGHAACMRYDAVPGVIFTHPQVGSVGLSLEAAKNKGFDATLAAYPMQALGKAQATQHEYGFAHIVVEKKTGRILGAQVVGEDAETLIAEMTMAISNELTIECISETIHAHPTYSEVWLEAAYVAMKQPLHFPKQSV